MSEPYEQMELDTRPKLQVAIEDLSAKAVSDAGELIQEHYRQVAVENMVAPPLVRNRHEAYGIAAEQLAKISGAVKSIKDDTASLLGTLSDPNLPALDATSSICNSTLVAATIIIQLRPGCSAPCGICTQRSGRSRSTPPWMTWLRAASLRRLNRQRPEKLAGTNPPRMNKRR